MLPVFSNFHASLWVFKASRLLACFNVMTVQQAYSDWAATYDTDPNRTRDLDQDVTRKTLSNRHFNSILEIGCGTGKNTAFLSTVGEQVLALDFSEGMLSQAKAKLQLKNVSFVKADLTLAWPCADRSMDLVACNLVLEHIADIGFVFSQASRSLRPRGRLFVCELHPFRQYQGAQAHFERGRQTNPIPAFVHHISDFLKAAESSGLAIEELREWWHPNDQNKPPRLISFLFTRPT